MNSDSRKPNDVTDDADDADEFAEFAVTMKRAGIDWEPLPPLPARTARGTAPPEPEPAADLAVDPDNDFDDVITLELPVLTRPASQYDGPVETESSFAQAEDTLILPRRRRSLVRLLAWAVALLLLILAIALLRAIRSDHSPAPNEPDLRSIGSAEAVVDLPEIVVELESPTSSHDADEGLVAAPPARDAE